MTSAVSLRSSNAGTLGGGGGGYEYTTKEHLQKDHAYLVFRENDLVRFINWSNKKGWKLGEDIGLISYDDTPIKEILAEGISVISNDFALMGKRAAEMILSHEKGRFVNESKFIERKSL